MPRFANSALRLLKRVLGDPAKGKAALAGSTSVLDGNTAVAMLEAGICEGAGLGATYPADAAVMAWRLEQNRQSHNPERVPLSGLVTESPRGALAAAMGLALSGTRATAFFSSTDLAAAQDLLTTAAGRHLPLVLHAGNRGLATNAPTLGSGHEVVHLAAESGVFVLMPANVQEAVDFAVIARQVSEQALIPGLVMQDGEQTALALQDVRMPPTALLKQFLGSAGEQIDSPTPTQSLLFGDTRRRVPRQVNADRPVMFGALLPAGTWGMAQAASAAFFDSGLGECLESAFREYARHTGRQYRPVTAHNVDGAKLILVVQGAAIETAEAVADHLDDLRVGVIGIRCLRPFPAAELADLLGKGARVCVLERMDAPFAADPPLMREVRSAVECALENGRFGDDCLPGRGSLNERQQPRLLSVIYGMGGFPLRSADLIALCRQAETLKRAKVYLGIRFTEASSSYPKRQVLLDRLRRSHPEISDLGLRAQQASPRLEPKESVSVALHRRSGGQGASLASALGPLLQGLLQGGLRCRPGQATESWGGCVVDRITAAAEAVRDPGDEIPVDLALVIAGSRFHGSCPAPEISEAGILLIVSRDEDLWSALPGILQSRVGEQGALLYQVQSEQAASETDNAYLVGAICAVLLETGHLDVTRHRLLRVQEELLQSNGDGRLLEHFENGLAAPRKIDTSRAPGGSANGLPGPGEDEAPATVRRLGNIDDGYDSLPRFWDQVGVLFRNGDVKELTADPYLALGAVPPLTAGFRDLSPLQHRLPVFDPKRCTGCGSCWSNCPDGAIGASILPPRRILEPVIREIGATAVQPLVGKLTAGIAASAADPDKQGFAAGDLVSGIFASLAEKLPFPEERKVTVSTEMEGLVERLGSLPLAVTAPFFGEPESEQPGSGELLVLTIDPSACKGCGICSQTCPAAAMDAAQRTPEAVTAARQLRSTWELLPASAAATVARAKEHPDLAAMAAPLLSRVGVPVLGSGDGGEPGSGARLALRMTLAAMEARQTGVFAEFLAQVQTAQQQITALIRESLADALPADDLDALARGLEHTDSRQADLSLFIGEAENAIGSAVDAAKLHRLVELARGLADLAWRLEEGRQGFGRSRVGLVLSAGSAAEWAGGFPHNPFTGPVVVDSTGDGVQIAAGLLEGQLRQTTDDAVLLRKARLEIEHPAEATRLWAELEALRWQELSLEEKARCPVMLLAGDSNTLGERGLSQLAAVLGGELPLKALVFADLDLGLGVPPEIEFPVATAPDTTANLALLTLSQRSASVAQTSIGKPAHFQKSLEQVITYKGPALLHVHAPSPTRHGFDLERTLERACEAVEARAFPLFRYDPEGKGVFGSRITLDGNPSPRSEWAEDPGGVSITPAHWALGESRFKDCFTPLTEDDPEPLPLVQYLQCLPEERGRKTPVVEQSAGGGDVRRFRVAEQLIRVSEGRLHAWRMLQELAGLVTPFTAQVQQEAEQRVLAAHQAELEAQASAYERRISILREEMLAQTRQDIRARLLQLAGYRAAPTDLGEGSGDSSRDTG